MIFPIEKPCVVGKEYNGRKIRRCAEGREREREPNIIKGNPILEKM